MFPAPSPSLSLPPPLCINTRKNVCATEGLDLMLCQKPTQYPFPKAWALFLLAVLLPAGLYFGFHVISIPAQSPVDHAQVSVPSAMALASPDSFLETNPSQDMISLNLASRLLNCIIESWFQSVLFALTVLLILLIVVATSMAILPHN